MTCVEMLDKWFCSLPPSITAKLYKQLLPKLSDYLNVENDVAVSHDSKAEFFHQRVLAKERDFGRRKVSRRDISKRVLALLGQIGGYAHHIISNEESRRRERENFIRWDSEKRLKFTLPLYNKKIDIYLDACLPRVVDLAQNASRKDVRIAACEFLHSLIIYMIGKNAQKSSKFKKDAKKKDEIDEEKMSEQRAFAKLYARLFPVIIRLACEIDQVPRQLFEPLCYQIVKWFSSSKMYEHPEVESLLDSLIEGAQDHSNNSLRQLCSNAVAVFAQWSLKHMTTQEIAQNPANIKSLIRRIQSNSNHPDSFKRLSAVLCFSTVFTQIREFDALVDQFSLDICFQVLGSLRLCYEKQE